MESSFLYHTDKNIFFTFIPKSKGNENLANRTDPVSIEFRDSKCFWKHTLKPDPEGRFIIILPKGFNILFGSIIIHSTIGREQFNVPYQYPEACCADTNYAKRWIDTHKKNGLEAKIIYELILCLRRMTLPSSPIRKILDQELKKLKD